MKIFLIVTAVISAILIINCVVWQLRYNKGKNIVLKAFRSGNCIVFGKKGKGKDLLFNYAINTRNELAYSNIQYNRELVQIKSIKEFSVEPNTFVNMLEDNVIKIKKNLKEHTDMYISDGGIYLPSQYANMLCKLYPSLPIFYATSRHLGEMNLHINTQYLGRVWDKLREQADTYFKVVGTRKSLFSRSLITEIIVYDTYKSAMAELLPFKTGLFKSAEEKAEQTKFIAKNGNIDRIFIKQHIKDIKYDTRYFHKVFYDKRSPNSA